MTDTEENPEEETESQETEETKDEEVEEQEIEEEEAEQSEEQEEKQVEEKVSEERGQQETEELEKKKIGKEEDEQEEPGEQEIGEEEQEETDEEKDEDLVKVVEAVLFSAGRPLTIPEIEESTGNPRKEVRQAVKKLRRMYRNRKSALIIHKIGRKYSLQLDQKYNQYGMKIMDEDIPKPILKTAALIAYYQPVKQSELKKMIGSQVYDHVDKLQEMDLILVEKEGRTYSIRTSPKFQEYFGLEAKNRNELKKIMAERAGLKR